LGGGKFGESGVDATGEAAQDSMSAQAIADNVGIAYGGSGDLYQRGLAGQTSSVGSLGNGEILAIAGDPSSSLYGAALEEMGRRGMDFGEQPIISAQANSRDAASRLFAAQEKLRAAITLQDKLAAEAAVKDAEVGVAEATSQREDTPKSILEFPLDDETGSGRPFFVPSNGTATAENNEEVVAEPTDDGPNLVIQDEVIPTSEAENRREAAEDGGGITSLKPVASDDQDAGGSTTSSGGAYGSIESRIAKMLSDREGSAEADKWMALAQTGMALMASKNPTFGGALGEAGLAGVGALQKSRKAYDSDIMSLLGMQQKIQSAKSLDASRAAKSTTGGSKALNTLIDNAQAELNAANSVAARYSKLEAGDPLAGTVDRMIDLAPPDVKANVVAAQERLRGLQRLLIGSGIQFDATQ
jgi:hypothetical protein